jgi:hypothetical protein
MTTTLSLSATQAGGQITRENYSWSAPLGTAAAPVTYGFLDKAPAATYGYEADSFSRVNDAERAAVVATLAEWAAVANITFQAVDPKAFTGSATMLFANFNQKIDDAGEDAGAAHAYAPITKDRSFASREGDVWFNLSSSPYNDIYSGSNDYSTLLHEIGHAIGLAHPGDYNAGDTKEPSTYENRAEYIEDSLQYTVMSYFDAAKTGANHTFANFTYQSVTPLRDDIVAIQRLYGANMNTRTDDTTYGFNSKADSKAFHLTDDIEAVFAIWDAGGTNTLDLSGYDTNQLLDLRPGAFSNAGALTKNISIALGTVIHNGIGGSGADKITGNDSNNELRGNDGDDTIDGGRGNDTIDGGDGHNVAAYEGPKNNYAITITAGAAAFTIDDKVGTDGSDTLTNIQNLGFTDTPLDASNFAKIRALSLSQINTLVDLYIAEDNRAPDALGLTYWAARLADGMTEHQMADNFFAQPEARGLYPSTQTNREFVTAAYLTLLERSPDAPGIDHWVRQLDDGTTRGVLLVDMIDGVRGEADARVLVNKEAVARHFAMTQGLNNAEWAKTVMASVNATAASVSAANQQTDNFAATTATPETSELVVKVLGIIS